MNFFAGKAQHLFWVGLFVFCVGGRNASAKEYFVSADGYGDFQTITQCMNVMQPGDICTVWPGTYPERIVIPTRLEGTSTQKTIFRAEPALQATMRGFDTKGTDYIRIEGFQITNTFTNLDGVGILIRSNNVEVVNNYMFNLAGHGICGYWNQPWSNNVWVLNNRMYRCRAGINIVGNNWLVEGNLIERLVQHIDADCDYTRFFGENIIIRNNVFRGTIRSEIGDAHVDGFQTYDDNGEYARNVLIEGNFVSDCHQGMMAEGKRYQHHWNITIRNNVFARCWAWGLDLHAMTNISVLNNAFYEMGLHGIGFRTGTTAVCKNNIFNTGNYWKDDASSVEAAKNLLYKPGVTWRQSDFPLDIVNKDPLFANPLTGDFNLKPASPAIDAGLEVGVDCDFDSKPRPLGDGIDIGPYEYEPRASAATWTRYH